MTCLQLPVGSWESVVLWRGPGRVQEFRVWRQRSWRRPRCSWTRCSGSRSRCPLRQTQEGTSGQKLPRYAPAAASGSWLPELVSDWHDLDFPIRDRRLAAAMVPSLEVLRLRTSLQETQTRDLYFHPPWVSVRPVPHQSPSSSCLSSSTVSPLFTVSSWAPAFS